MNDIDGEVRIKQFQYLLNDDNLYEKVVQFCEDHNVLHSFCNVLWNEVLNRSVMIKNLSIDRSSSISSVDNDFTNVDNNNIIIKITDGDNVLDNATTKIYDVTNDIKLNIDKDIDVGNDTDVVLPNSHLLRYNQAIAAEIRVLTRPTDYNIGMLSIEQDILTQLLTTTFDTRVPPKRICVIHSCTLDVTQSYSHRILEDIVTKVQSSGLMSELDSVLIFNYGYNLSVELQNRYPNVVFMNVHRDTSNFEIPTLRLIHQLAQHWKQGNDYVDNHYDTHILYLHTKGVSYKEIYPQIEDWRNMMLYFLVERYKSCYHLLASDEIDCIGNNFLTMTKKHFSGNYWWATSSYLSQLPELLIYGRDMKYEAEWWLLDSMHVRIFIMHSSSIDHAHQIYPRYCYDPSYSRPLSSSPSSSSIPLSSSSSNHHPHHSIYKELRDSSVCGEKKTRIVVTSLTINNNN
jgi:hypothetical protein